MFPLQNVRFSECALFGMGPFRNLLFLECALFRIFFFCNVLLLWYIPILPGFLKLSINYRKVASSRLSRLVAHLHILRLFMNGKFDAYVL